MNQETVNECCELFEQKTGRKITETEKECITIACIKGETYGCIKFVDARKTRRDKRGRRNWRRKTLISKRSFKSF